MEEQPDEHQNTVTEELLQIVEDFADYIDVFLFEIVTFLAVVNSFLILLYDLLSLFGLHGWALSILPTLGFLLSISLFLFGAKKRSGKRNSNKLAVLENAVNIEDLGDAMDAFSDVLEVVDEVKDVTEKISTGQDEIVSLLSGIDIEPNETSEEKDQTSDDLDQDTTNQDYQESTFRRAVRVVVTIARAVQKKKEQNLVLNDLQSRTVSHDSHSKKTAAEGEKPVNEDDLHADTITKKLTDTAYQAEDVIQEAATMVSTRTVEVGQCIQKEAEDISGYLTQESIKVGKQLENEAYETCELVKQGAEKVVEEGTKVSSEVKRDAGYIGISLTGETDEIITNRERAVEEDLSRGNSGEVNPEEASESPKKTKKRIAKNVIKGASSKAKKLNAKRKKGINRVRRRKPKSLIQIYRRLGRLILRVICKQTKSNTDAANQTGKPDEAFTPFVVPQKIASFFVGIYQDYKTRQKGRLKMKKVLSRVRIVKVPGSLLKSTESSYVIYDEDLPLQVPHTEHETRCLLPDETGENALRVGCNTENDLQARACTYDFESKPRGNVSNLQRKIGLAINEKLNDNMLTNNWQEENDSNEICEENMSPMTRTKTWLNDCEESQPISLTINDLDSPIVIHSLPNVVSLGRRNSPLEEDNTGLKPGIYKEGRLYDYASHHQIQKNLHDDNGQRSLANEDSQLFIQENPNAELAPLISKHFSDYNQTLYCSDQEMSSEKQGQLVTRSDSMYTKPTSTNIGQDDDFVYMISDYGGLCDQSSHSGQGNANEKGIKRISHRFYNYNLQQSIQHPILDFESAFSWPESSETLTYDSKVQLQHELQLSCQEADYEEKRQMDFKTNSVNSLIAHSSIRENCRLSQPSILDFEPVVGSENRDTLDHANKLQNYSYTSSDPMERSTNKSTEHLSLCQKHDLKPVLACDSARASCASLEILDSSLDQI